MTINFLPVNMGAAANFCGRSFFVPGPSLVLPLEFLNYFYNRK